MPVTHGVTGSSPVRTAINIENQCFAKQTPDFTPKNVKSGVFCIIQEKHRAKNHLIFVTFYMVSYLNGKRIKS